LAEFFSVQLLLILLGGRKLFAGVVLKGTKSENSGWLRELSSDGDWLLLFAVYAVGSISGSPFSIRLSPLPWHLKGDFPWSEVGGIWFY